jgi:hypothetical protein
MRMQRLYRQLPVRRDPAAEEARSRLVGRTIDAVDGPACCTRVDLCLEGHGSPINRGSQQKLKLESFLVKRAQPLSH